MEFLDDLGQTISKTFAKADQLLTKNTQADNKLAIAELKLLIRNIQNKLSEVNIKNAKLKKDLKLKESILLRWFSLLEKR